MKTIMLIIASFGSSLLQTVNCASNAEIDLGTLITNIQASPATSDLKAAKLAAIKASAHTKPTKDLVFALLDNLDFTPLKNGMVPVDPMNMKAFEMFPAADALKAMPQSVLPWVVEYLKRELPETTRSRATMVFLDMAGDNAAKILESQSSSPQLQIVERTALKKSAAILSPKR